MGGSQKIGDSVRKWKWGDYPGFSKRDLHAIKTMSLEEGGIRRFDYTHRGCGHKPCSICSSEMLEDARKRLSTRPSRRSTALMTP